MASSNTALSLGRLNQKVYFFSRISNDFFGEKIINFLNKNKLNSKKIGNRVYYLKSEILEALNT